MAKETRGRRYEPKPVKKIELSEKYMKLRWVLAAILFIVGIGALMYGVLAFLNTQPGWETVEVPIEENSCADDFQLVYNFASSGGNASFVNKSLIQCYSEAAVKAEKIFSCDIREDGLGNMAWLNDNVNLPVKVEPGLYEALKQVSASGSRQLFLAPAAVEYDRVFMAESAGEAESYDPAKNPELQSWLEELSAFINDPGEISLEILLDNQVCLRVGEGYLAFAKEYEITEFADFGWMRNAFAVDFLAQTLLDSGFQEGYLVSYDGFTRNLNPTQEAFSFNIYDRQEHLVHVPGRVNYLGPMSIVFLRDYPVTEKDRWTYYVYETGEIVCAMLNAETCMSSSAMANLVSYSHDLSCGEILLKTADIFTAQELNVDAIQALTADGIHSIWPEGTELCYNDSDMNWEVTQKDAIHSFRLK